MDTPLLIQALTRQATPRPPLWLMRQAGRYLPEYMSVRARYPGFLDFCLTPSAATAVTLQPVYRFNLDAAIIFADILTIPDALGHKVVFTTSHGPIVERIHNPGQVKLLDKKLPALLAKLAPVADTVTRARATLPPDKAVIGFSGAPFTLACYMLDEKPSLQASATIAFAAAHPKDFQKLIHILTEAVIAYLDMQLLAGADAVQIFDSWSSLCPPELWETTVHKPLVEIVTRLRANHQAPVILFPRAASPENLVALAAALDGKNAALGLSQEVNLAWACEHLQPHVAIQGNLDPYLLTLDDPNPLRAAATAAIRLGQKKPGFVLNTGHGLTPNTRIERVDELSRLVLEWKG